MYLLRKQHCRLRHHTNFRIGESGVYRPLRHIPNDCGAFPPGRPKFPEPENRDVAQRPAVMGKLFGSVESLRQADCRVCQRHRHSCLGEQEIVVEKEKYKEEEYLLYIHKRDEVEA